MAAASAATAEGNGTGATCIAAVGDRGLHQMNARCGWDIYGDEWEHQMNDFAGWYTKFAHNPRSNPNLDLHPQGQSG